MLPLYQHEAARRDLVAHFVYLAENASMATADRFLANVKTSFNQLAKNPTIGAPLSLQNPALAGTRKWRVKGFDKYLIFYLAEHDRVAIVRVLHSSTDWWHVLGLESPNES